MNILRLSVKNWRHFAKEHLLSILLIATSLALIMLGTRIQKGMQSQFEKNLAGVDMILAAKGSPMQILMNALFHIDAPSGNLQVEKISPFLRTDHPLIKTAVPLALGDSYQKYRIVGTTRSFDSLYRTQIAVGRNWQKAGEVVLGAEVAEKLNLSPGDAFHSTHGYHQGDLSHEITLRVVGILEREHAVVDQLILTGIPSIWESHEESHADTQNAEGQHSIVKNVDLLSHLDEEVTSVLIDFQGNNMRTLNWPRQINANTEFQAVTPALEAAHLYRLIGGGERVLKLLGYALLFIALLSLILSLYLNMDNRRVQLAIMRMSGMGFGKRVGSFLLEISYSLLLGIALAFLLATVGTLFLSDKIYEVYRLRLETNLLSGQDLLYMALFLASGILAVLLPIWQSARTEIAYLIKR